MSENISTVALSRDHVRPDPERRVSIWSVPVDFGPWFYLLLVTHTAPLIFLLWWTDVTPKTNDNIANIIVNVTSGTAPMIFVAAVSTIIELEVLVVLREWYRDRAARKERERVEAKKEREMAEARREREKAETIEEQIRDAYEQGRRDERRAQTALRDAPNENDES